MTTPERKISDITTKLEEVANIDLDAALAPLLPYPDLIADLPQRLRLLVSLCGPLSKANLASLPPYIREEVWTVAMSIRAHLDSCSKLQIISTAPASGQVTSFLQSMQRSPQSPNIPGALERYQDSLVRASSVASALGAFSNPMQQLEVETAKVAELLAFGNQAKADMESLLAAMRSTSEKGAVESQKQFFAALADGHKRLGSIWMAVFIMLSISSVVASWFLTLALANELGNASLNPTPLWWLRLLPEVFTVSTVTGMAVWSSRNYKAHRHLHVMNVHKATALATFRAFTEAAQTSSEDVRSAILIECTRSIFAAPDTGYQGSTETINNSGMLDMLRALRGGTI